MAIDEAKINWLREWSGTSTLQSMWNLEDACELETDRRAPSMGVRAPKCLEQVGRCLAILDCLSSCFFECKGDDHIIEYITGRVAASMRAALRLMRLGFYDEALALCRNAGEIANLLMLFGLDDKALAAWRIASPKERKNTYSPTQVRKSLEANGITPPIAQDRYSRLCEEATHVTPHTKPQARNPLGVPTSGGYFQDGGLLLALNEIAIVLAYVTPIVAKLLSSPRQVQELALEHSAKLVDAIGAVQITEIDKIWKKTNIDP